MNGGSPFDRIRRSPIALIPMIFIMQVFFWVSVRFQLSSWPEDDGPPLRMTAEWIPGRQYPPEIEQALQLLARSDPSKVTYLRSYGVPIHALTPREMAVSGCPAGSLGCTRKANSSVNVNALALGQSPALAAILSHEIAHVQTHDPIHPLPKRSLLQRIFGRNEEATAHVAGLRTANRLHVPEWRGILGGWPIEYLVWYWPFGTFLYTMTFSALGLRRLFLEVGQATLRQRARKQALGKV